MAVAIVKRLRIKRLTPTILASEAIQTKKLVLTAVSQQTKVPKKMLLSQMDDTHLSYCELLTANSLVELE